MLLYLEKEIFFLHFIKKENETKKYSISLWAGRSQKSSVSFSPFQLEKNMDIIIYFVIFNFPNVDFSFTMATLKHTSPHHLYLNFHLLKKVTSV